MSAKTDVKIFKTQRGDSIPKWLPLIEALEKRGHRTYKEAEPCDVSIALSGQFENPLALHGKRVLAYVPQEWKPEYYGWRFFARILEHYYHDFIDLTGTDIYEAANRIEEYIKGCSKTES